jgi:hypothetical protein
MIRGLARKELREMRPWAVLGIIFAFIEFAAEFSRKTDLRPLGLTFHALVSDVVISWFLAFAIGTTLGTREEDDGTLGFLDGLPVTRSRVFLVKLGVATGVLLIFPFAKALIAVVQHLLSRGSLDHELHGLIVLQLLGVQVLHVFSGIVFGAALGRLRSLTWLVAGVLAIALTVLLKEVPRAALLDPLALAELETRGQRLQLDVELLAVQAGLAAMWTLIAWAGFVRTGRAWFPDLSKRPVVSALVTVFTIAAVITAVSLREDDDEVKERRAAKASTEPRFEQSAPASTSTTHYRFSYPAQRAQEALALADQADAIFEKVHALLNVPPGDPIDVDASGSLRTTAGTAFLGGLRMELGSDAPRVLAHETSHVVSRRIAGDARAFLWNDVLVLNEGLASWVERHFDAGEEARAESRLVLAALQKRGELRVEELVDDELLARNRDDLLKYSAGEAIIDAIVKVYGAEALPKLVAAFADEKLPLDLRGLALWQACFQLAGMDLGRVIDAFFREVEQNARQSAEALRTLPRPRVELLSAEGWYGARAVIDGEDELPEGWSLSLRFRPANDSPFSTYDTFTVEPGEPSWREAHRIRKGQICVQAGVRLPEGNVLYEPWECLPVRDALPWTE